MPSRRIIGVIATAASGSAHHQANIALSATPARAITESHAHKDVCIASDQSPRLPISSATLRLALASTGMTAADNRRTLSPTTLLNGCQRGHRDCVLPITMQTGSATQAQPI